MRSIKQKSKSIAGVLLVTASTGPLILGRARGQEKHWLFYGRARVLLNIGEPENDRKE